MWWKSFHWRISVNTDQAPSPASLPNLASRLFPFILIANEMWKSVGDKSRKSLSPSKELCPWRKCFKSYRDATSPLYFSNAKNYVSENYLISYQLPLIIWLFSVEKLWQSCKLQLATWMLTDIQNFGIQ